MKPPEDEVLGSPVEEETYQEPKRVKRHRFKTAKERIREVRLECVCVLYYVLSIESDEKGVLTRFLVLHVVEHAQNKKLHLGWSVLLFTLGEECITIMIETNSNKGYHISCFVN